jgi:hypothetical protein
MRSFSLQSDAVRDTPIPAGCIPMILLHWLHVYYYGGRITIPQFRTFLESKLRENLYSKGAVDQWVRDAQNWIDIQEKKQKGRHGELLEEYFDVNGVA